MPQAAIDLGSNSVLLTVLDDDGEVLHDEARVVGLGKGLGDGGVFAPDRMRATELALGDYAAIASTFGVPAPAVMAITTSAARRARNAPEWFRHLGQTTGLHFRIISGDEEARLTWAGATSDVSDTGRMMVIDLGGGSTEVVIGTAQGLENRISLEIGSVRHTESHLGVQRIAPDRLLTLRGVLQDAVARIPFDLSCDRAIGVAGTVTTLAAMDLGLATWDRERVHHSTLTDAALRRWAHKLAASDRKQRAQLAAVSPKRADFLVAGAEILLALLAACGQQHLLVSDKGIRYGALCENRRR